MTEQEILSQIRSETEAAAQTIAFSGISSRLTQQRPAAAVQRQKKIKRLFCSGLAGLAMTAAVAFACLSGMTSPPPLDVTPVPATEITTTASATESTTVLTTVTSAATTTLSSQTTTETTGVTSAADRTTVPQTTPSAAPVTEAVTAASSATVQTTSTAAVTTAPPQTEATSAPTTTAVDLSVTPTAQLCGETVEFVWAKHYYAALPMEYLYEESTWTIEQFYEYFGTSVLPEEPFGCATPETVTVYRSIAGPEICIASVHYVGTLDGARVGVKITVARNMGYGFGSVCALSMAENRINGITVYSGTVPVYRPEEFPTPTGACYCVEFQKHDYYYAIQATGCSVGAYAEMLSDLLATGTAATE